MSAINTGGGGSGNLSLELRLDNYRDELKTLVDAKKGYENRLQMAINNHESDGTILGLKTQIFDTDVKIRDKTVQINELSKIVEKPSAVQQEQDAIADALKISAAKRKAEARIGSLDDDGTITEQEKREAIAYINGLNDLSATQKASYNTRIGNTTEMVTATPFQLAFGSLDAAKLALTSAINGGEGKGVVSGLLATFKTAYNTFMGFSDSSDFKADSAGQVTSLTGDYDTLLEKADKYIRSAGPDNKSDVDKYAVAVATTIVDKDAGVAVTSQPGQPDTFENLHPNQTPAMTTTESTGTFIVGGNVVTGGNVADAVSPTTTTIHEDAGVAVTSQPGQPDTFENLPGTPSKTPVNPTFVVGGNVIDTSSSTSVSEQVAAALNPPASNPEPAAPPAVVVSGSGDTFVNTNPLPAAPPATMRYDPVTRTMIPM